MLQIDEKDDRIYSTENFVVIGRNVYMARKLQDNLESISNMTNVYDIKLENENENSKENKYLYTRVIDARSPIDENAVSIRE